MYEPSILERQVAVDLKLLDRDSAPALIDFMKQALTDGLFVSYLSTDSLSYGAIGPSYGRMKTYPNLQEDLDLASRLGDFSALRSIVEENLFFEYETLERNRNKVCDSYLILKLNGTMFSPVRIGGNLVGVYLTGEEGRRFILSQEK